MQSVQLWDLLPWKKHVTKMSDCGGALAKLVLRKMHTKTSLMKLQFSARKAVHDCYQCWKFELKISSDSGDMHFSAIKPRWGGCPPLKCHWNSESSHHPTTRSKQVLDLASAKIHVPMKSSFYRHCGAHRETSTAAQQCLRPIERNSKATGRFCKAKFVCKFSWNWVWVHTTQ